MHKSEYQICLECARRVKAEHAQRNLTKSTPPAPGHDARHVLAGIPNVSSPRSSSASPASSRAESGGDLFHEAER